MGTQNMDTAVFHRPTSTLLVADLLFNLPPNQQYGTKSDQWNFILRTVFGSFRPESTAHKFLVEKALTKSSDDMKKDAKYVVDNWKVNRIIMCHGDVIETNGLESFKKLYGSFL